MQYLHVSLVILLVAICNAQPPLMNLEFPLYVSNEVLYVALKTLSGTRYDAVLKMHGAYSVCPLPVNDNVFVDNGMFKYYMLVDHVASALTSTCTFDAYYLFDGRFRYMRLAYDRLQFMESLPTHIAWKDWFKCNQASQYNSLCEHDADDTTFLVFSDLTNYDETRTSFVLGNVTYTPGDTWRTTTNKVMTLPLHAVLDVSDLYYDVTLHRIAMLPRYPVAWIATTCGVLVGILCITFVFRFHIDTLSRKRGIHIFLLIVSVVGIALAFFSRTRVLANPLFAGAILLACVMYLVLEFDRCEDTEWLIMRPDMALLLLALILLFYVVCTFTFYIVWVAFIIGFVAKTIGQVQYVRVDPPAFAIGAIADVIAAVALLHFMFVEFVDTCPDGTWWLLVIFIVLLTLVASVLITGIRHSYLFDAKETTTTT